MAAAVLRCCAPRFPRAIGVAPIQRQYCQQQQRRGIVIRPKPEPAELVRLSYDVSPVTGQRSGVAVLTLNRPHALNALTEQMSVQFLAAVHKICDDADVSALVLRGEGRAFSAGGDYDFLLERTRDQPTLNAERMKTLYHRFLHIRKVPVPVIAALNGAAVAGGFCLAIASDIRIVATEGPFGFTFANMGIHPGMGITHFLPRLLGHERATDMLITGELLNGQEVVRRGLALEAHPAADVVPAALERARMIAKRSGVVVRAVLHDLRAAQDAGLEEAMQAESVAQARCFAHPDIVEGIRACREKRLPSYSARPAGHV